MRTLQALYTHNAWANAQLFAVCRGLDRALLEESAPGTFGTIEATLKHLVGVEDAYARMLRGESPGSAGSFEDYFGHDLAWFEARSSRLGEEYEVLLATAQAAFLDDELRVPWFDFRLTNHDGLLQVLSHSAQHRAQVFSVLGERGLKVPDLDYVIFVRSRLPGTK
jgi:uncharacterized damage-inducible protein DinB